jgi:NitT/TauT family transport system permease protein
VVAFLLTWQVATAEMNPLLMPQPTAVIQALVELLLNGELIEALRISLMDLFFGFGAAVLFALVVGTLMGKFGTAEKVLSPYVAFFIATPTIALVPLIIIWFGFGNLSRAVIVFLISVWPVVVNVVAGVKSTERILRQVTHAFRLDGRQYVRWIALPSAVPYIFSGLKIGLGKAIIGMFVAEMTMDLTGLGGLVLEYGNAFKTAHLLAGVVTASLFGVLMFGALELAQRKLCPWVAGQRGLGQE